MSFLAIHSIKEVKVYAKVRKLCLNRFSALNRPEKADDNYFRLIIHHTIPKEKRTRAKN